MTKQQKLDKIFIDLAINTSLLSKCVSIKVGSVLVKEGRPISIGYNGTPEGFINCNEHFDEKAFNREEHHCWSSKYEIHSEMNTLGFASRKGIDTSNSILYSSLQPCNDCLRNVIAFGIKRIVYLNEYDKCVYDPTILKMLDHSGIILEQYKE